MSSKVAKPKEKSLQRLLTSDGRRQKIRGRGDNCVITKLADVTKGHKEKVADKFWMIMAAWIAADRKRENTTRCLSGRFVLLFWWKARRPQRGVSLNSVGSANQLNCATTDRSKMKQFAELTPQQRSRMKEVSQTSCPHYKWLPLTAN